MNRKLVGQPAIARCTYKRRLHVNYVPRYAGHAQSALGVARVATQAWSVSFESTNELCSRLCWFYHGKWRPMNDVSASCSHQILPATIFRGKIWSIHLIDFTLLRPYRCLQSSRITFTKICFFFLLLISGKQTCVVMSSRRSSSAASEASSSITDEVSPAFKDSFRDNLDLWSGDVPSENDPSFQSLIQSELTISSLNSTRRLINNYSRISRDCRPTIRAQRPTLWCVDRCIR